jgi:hypothetical protein
MDINEYIKQMVRKMMDEESASGGAGGYLTPNAFAKKGQGKNAATKAAEKQGFKVAPEGMPSDSKVKDYKAIWGKKKKYKIYQESEYDRASVSSLPSGYDAPSPSSDPSLYLKKSEYTSENMNTLLDIIDQELINEATYSKFKKEISYRSKTEMLHKGIKQVKRKLAEIDRIVEYTSRMKQELSEGEEGIKYWKATVNNVTQISEMVNNLNEKIKNLYQ